MVNNAKKRFRRFLGNLILLLSAGLFFALAFPNFITVQGFSIFGFFCLVPVFFLIRRASWKSIVFYGMLYGFIGYAIMNYWLSDFHPLAIFIVPAVYIFYFLVFFPLLKLVDVLFPRISYLLFPFLWVAYEYVKTLGFLGYPYGILGYTQYNFLPLARISSLTGVWGVSFLLVACSAWIFALLGKGLRPETLKQSLKELKVSGLVLVGLFAVVFLYGGLSVVDYSESPTWEVVLVQQNIDPWRGGIDEYERTFEILAEQTDKALAEYPNTDLVAWSETSFVPGIDYNQRYWTDDRRRNLVLNLQDYLGTLDVPVLVGNDDARRINIGFGNTELVHYNAALLWQDGGWADIYRKMRLVPFTEHFPYEKQLPWIYDLLQQFETPFWVEGEDYVTFEQDGVVFSANVCFEDVFGYIGRDFVNAGSQVLVNMTNDSWANSAVCEMQHMTIGLFRAIENRRSIVRSTQGGVTVAVDPNGRILGELEPFTEGFLHAEIPVYDDTTTLYTRWGDWFAVLSLVLSLTSILAGTAVFLFRRLSSR